MADNDYYELNRLTLKIDELIDKFRGVTAECSRLQQLNNSLAIQLKERDIQIEELKQKIEKIKLSGALLGGGEYTDIANKKIDELVREIDKCVALLNV